jgi:hypothetical protein
LDEPEPAGSAPEIPDHSGDPLSELHGLMKKNPKIKIMINQNRTTLQVPPDWQRRNGSAFARISRLVYFDPAVFGFLHGHGADIINCDNLILQNERN